jgi:hypothetical protein
MPRVDMPAPLIQKPSSIEVPEDVFLFADMRHNMLPPPYYNYLTTVSSTHEVKLVSLTDIVIDGEGRLVAFDKERLKSVIKAIKEWVALPPVSVTRCLRGYKLENGFHRFYACVIIGVSSIPIDMEKQKAKYVPPALRRSGAPY